MHPIRLKRTYWIAVFVFGIGLIVALVLYALRQNINLFFTPTEAVESIAPMGKPIRLGGMVLKNSLARKVGLKVTFAVTDFNQTVEVEYEGILPDLFREGQGVVMLGELQSSNKFVAKQVLAKHDENYMPPEVNKALAQRYIGDDSNSG